MLLVPLVVLVHAEAVRVDHGLEERVRHVADFTLDVLALPPLTIVVQHLQIFAARHRQLAMILSASRISAKRDSRLFRHQIVAEFIVIRNDARIRRCCDRRFANVLSSRKTLVVVGDEDDAGAPAAVEDGLVRHGVSLPIGTRLAPIIAQCAPNDELSGRELRAQHANGFSREQRRSDFLDDVLAKHLETFVDEEGQRREKMMQKLFGVRVAQVVLQVALMR